MNHKLSKIRLAVFIVCALITFAADAQKKKQPDCKILGTDLNDLPGNYQRYHKCLGVKSGENVASIGAGYARIELHVSLFVDSIQWTLQDIDTTCLSQTQLRKSIKIYEKASGKKINSSFKTLLGTTDDTNLPENTFDRILMVDTYHELTSKESILRSARRALKDSGRFVMLERIGKTEGEILGCKFPAVMERDLIPDIQKYGFEFESKVVANEKLSLIYYTFKINR